MLLAGGRRLFDYNDVTSHLDDAKQGFTSFVDRFWGGCCCGPDQCVGYIATCGSEGESNLYFLRSLLNIYLR